MFKKNVAPKIEFAIRAKLDGAFPEPAPASRFVPNWYKRLASVVPDDGKNFPTPTVKRCMPFLDAMTAGYIIPLPAAMRVVADEIGNINFSWVDDEWKAIEQHHGAQIAGTPHENTPAFKFISPWVVKLPAGYSALFVHPLNRGDLPFECYSGVVELDTYHNEVNFPFRWTQFPYDGILEAGTPIGQIIPFKREDWSNEVRRLTDEEADNADRIMKMIPAIGLNGYKKKMWVRKVWG